MVRLPSPLCIGLAAVVLGAAYAAFYWHFMRTGPTYQSGGVKYLLDVERATVRANWEGKPVLLYFTGVNATNCRWMEKHVLDAPNVRERLRKFVSVAVFIDSVPIGDEKVAERLRIENEKLQADLFADAPSFVVVYPDFKSPGSRDRRTPFGIMPGTSNESEFIQFLDRALDKWDGRAR